STHNTGTKTGTRVMGVQGQNGPENRFVCRHTAHHQPRVIRRKMARHESRKGGTVMAALDWSACSVVESVPGKVSGAWVFKGTRTPVATIFENLEDGMTIDEVLEQFPVTREQVKAVLEFAARSLDTPVSGR